VKITREKEKISHADNVLMLRRPKITHLFVVVVFTEKVSITPPQKSSKLKVLFHTQLKEISTFT